VIPSRRTVYESLTTVPSEPRAFEYSVALENTIGVKIATIASDDGNPYLLIIRTGRNQGIYHL
jgi:hypothetical protein